MNTADRKGDTAKGARAIANANARRWDRAVTKATKIPKQRELTEEDYEPGLR